MKKSFIYFLCLLATFAVFTSCDEQEQEQETKKELIIGNWVSTADNYEELLKFALEDIDQEVIEMMGEIRLAMQFNADGTARTGIFAEFYANYGILKENEYLDMYSSNESTGMPSISFNWKLSEDGNSIITSLYAPSFEQNGQTIPETKIEESYNIVVLNENELTLKYNNPDDPSLNISIEMVHPTEDIRFITIDEVSGGLSILPKTLEQRQ